jgi:hypothetical protein
MARKKKAEVQATETTAPTDVTNTDLVTVKRNLDVALTKIESGRINEEQGKKQWIEGTLELIAGLDDGRNRFSSDQTFGKWLDENGYDDRITRHDRSALLNMAKHPDITREVLEQTHSRSWQLIWRDEIQPRLPNARQPADGENSEADPTNNPKQSGEALTNNPEQSANDPKPEATTKRTRRPRRGTGTKKPKTEWGKDLNDFMSDSLLAANAFVRIKNSILESPPEKKAELLKKVTPEWSDKIELGSKAGAWIRDWGNGSLEEAADVLIQKDRVVRTPARASRPVQREA